jgi:hypothetical protein
VTGTIRATANDILNQVGVEVGLDPSVDPFSSQDQSYRQMTYLINTAGEELSQLFPWDFLRKEMTITTDGTGDYDLPADYLYLMNQTGWDRTNDNPVSGPLSPQDWAYLEGRDIVNSTLYLSYRLKEDKISLYPQPDEVGLDIRFEYINRNWVLDSTTGNTYIDKCNVGADEPLFNRTLLGRMLKVKFLEAKGMDASKAQADLNQAFELLVARNKGAPLLSARAGGRAFPYLNYDSIPESGYGS